MIVDCGHCPSTLAVKWRWRYVFSGGPILTHHGDGSHSVLGGTELRSEDVWSSVIRDSDHGAEVGVDWVNGLVLHEHDHEWHPWDPSVYGDPEQQNGDQP